jgi:diacylglycerol kinase family enzyme
MSNKNPSVFERIFVLFNPASTRAKRSAKRIAELKRLYPGKVEVIKTSPKGRAGNQAVIHKLAKRLTTKTLIVIAAGDGTVGLIVEALTTTGEDSLSKEARQAPILPMWGGNANDLAHMLNGKSYGRRLGAVISKAKIVPIFPLTCTIRTGGQTACYSAACYIAFGVSGRMAQTLNGKMYRKNAATKVAVLKLAHELRYVSRTFRRATRFAYTSQGKKHHVYELLFANGSRMAKVNRLPVTLSEPYFYADHLRHSTFVAIMRKLFAVAMSKHSPKREQQLHTKMEFTIHDQVWAQFDGEPQSVPAGSQVTVELHSQPFYALASALHEPAE